MAATRRKRRRWPWVVGGVLALLGAAGYVTYGGGKHEGPGQVSKARVPAAASRAIAGQQQATRRRLGAPDKQILFGDLHVHSTFSGDAFMRSLPLAGGEGAHPPADACDFARFCSALDFYALTDHAEGLTPRHWRETKESVRQCNAAAGDPKNPDVVAYVGWEWTQVGATPAEHFGHKNVIFKELADDKLPVRPIAAPGLGSAFRNVNAMGGNFWTQLLIPILEFPRRQRYLNFRAFAQNNAAVAICPRGIDTRKLPADCREMAETPQVLFEKLGQWGFDSLVIPHGTTWGFYTPPGYLYDKQLTRAQHDDRQRLIEIYSGHGNSEEYRAWRSVAGDPNKAPICPAPTPGYEPCCWRAGEIIRGRCGNLPAAECERRVKKARADYVAVGVAGHLTVPGATLEDWKDCDQCRDCFNPAFNYRPGGSVQYIAARTVFPKDGTAPLKPVWGFIASSDNHSARPGTGYKEYARRKMTEAAGVRSAAWRERFMGKPQKPVPASTSLTREQVLKRPPFQVVHVERQASFFMTGGLVAVHSAGRDRDAIWKAMKKREVYGTSGGRILLWFDLVGGPGKRHPMGSEVPLATPPRFVVRAAGDFKQKPGCPEWSRNALGADRLARICAGECYHPSDERRRITRIEVVRIRPQRERGEVVARLIDDPWRKIPCPPGSAGCKVEFTDPDFPTGGRDVLYYVRAIEEPTPAVNAGGVRCERDSDGGCRKARPCYGDYRTPYQDDCLSPNEERAWSSPIYVRWRPAAAPAAPKP